MTWPAIRRELHYGRVVRCFVDRPSFVHTLLEEAAQSAPNATAIVAGDETLSYAALEEQVGRIATSLSARGLIPGDRLAVLLGNQPEFLKIVLAASRAGLVVVPLNIRCSRSEIASILQDSGAVGLVYNEDCVSGLPDPLECLALKLFFAVGTPACAGHAPFNDLLGRAPTSDTVPARSEDDAFCILYTSGTTGRPKGAVLTHLGAIHSVLHYQYGLGLERGDIAALAVPASHVTGLVAILLTMLRVAGATVFMKEFRARLFLELAERERVTYTLMVPAMYKLCLLDPDFAGFDLSRWRVGGFGGAPMPESTIKQFAAGVPRLSLSNIYGATETTSPVTMVPPGRIAEHADSVGLALPCADIFIADGDGREVPLGERGEVEIGGPMVIPGYWNNPVADAATFAGGFWRSGDIGFLDSDGYLHIQDRMKDVINRGGYKVYTIEVEGAVVQHPSVVECAVVGYPDEVLGEKVEAFVCVRDSFADGNALRSFCAERIADYKIPDRIVFLPTALPRNAAGKVLKSSLRARARELPR